MYFQKKYLVIFLILVTEVLGFSLILPFLPFYAQEFGASPLLIGLIMTSFSLFQFISAPIMGRLSDYYGRKPLLIASQISTCISFIVLGFADALWMIYLSRIIDGALGSNMTIAQAYLSDISSQEERSKAFGLSGVAFGFGFLIGPAIGGYLSRFGYHVPAFLAAGVALLTIVITIFFLPETIKKKPTKKQKIKIVDIAALRKYFATRQTTLRLMQFFAYMLNHVVWVSSFALYAEGHLGLGAQHISITLMFIGLTSILFRGVLLSKLIDRFGEKRLIAFGMTAVLLSMISAVFINAFWMMILLMAVFASGNGLARPLLMGTISRSVSPQEQGAIMGVANSLGSMAMIIGPIAGTFVIQTLAPGYLGVLAATCMFVGMILFVIEQKYSIKLTQQARG